MKKEKDYICVGQNFVNGRLLDGAKCGDIHTLKEWLEICFPNKQDIVNDFFKGYSDKDICEYVYKNCGVRLKEEKIYKLYGTDISDYWG